MGNIGITVIIILILCFIFIAVSFICCCEKCDKSKKEDKSTLLNQVNLMVPPVFYTDCDKDPLYQDDMMERPLASVN